MYQITWYNRRYRAIRERFDSWPLPTRPDIPAMCAWAVPIVISVVTYNLCLVYLSTSVCVYIIGPNYTRLTQTTNPPLFTGPIIAQLLHTIFDTYINTPPWRIWPRHLEAIMRWSRWTWTWNIKYEIRCYFLTSHESTCKCSPFSFLYDSQSPMKIKFFYSCVLFPIPRSISPTHRTKTTKSPYPTTP